MREKVASVFNVEIQEVFQTSTHYNLNPEKCQ